MNWDQFKYPVSHMCLAGAVIAPWSLTQEVADSNPFTVLTNIFRRALKTFRENSIKAYIFGNSLSCCLHMISKNKDVKFLNKLPHLVDMCRDKLNRGLDEINLECTPFKSYKSIYFLLLKS